jgi:hypothetical protein
MQKENNINNLDDLTSGKYFAWGYVDIIQNSPTRAGTCFVIAGIQSNFQICFPYEFDTNKKIFFRSYYSNAYSKWNYCSITELQNV